MLSIVGSYFLLRAAIINRKSIHHKIGFLIFGLSLVTMYTCSTVYHASGIRITGTREEKDAARASLRNLDHMAIFVLISGTYTPTVLIILMKHAKHQKLGIFALASQWVCTFTGIIIKGVAGASGMPEWVTNLLYLLLGWSVLLYMKPMLRVGPKVVMSWMLAGGLWYSLGVWFLTWDDLHFNHCIWHLHTMLGSFTHLIGVLLLAYPWDKLMQVPTGILPTLNTALELLRQLFFSFKTD